MARATRRQAENLPRAGNSLSIFSGKILRLPLKHVTQGVVVDYSVPPVIAADIICFGRLLSKLFFGVLKCSRSLGRSGVEM
jgi:hypothetical protein